MARAPVEAPEPTASRRDDAYEQILSAIIFGDLAPGSLVEEKRLVADFGIGLAGVRDALYRLALEGLIERHARIGTRVCDLGIRELQDVFEARVLLEGSSAVLAAERASPAEIAQMRSAFAGFEEVIRKRDFRKLIRMDQIFHRAIAAATKNKLIERQIVVLHNNASRFWYFGILRLDSNQLKADIRLHLDVVDAIEAHKPAAAESAMRMVLGHFPESVRLFFPGSIGALSDMATADRLKSQRKRARARTTT